MKKLHITFSILLTLNRLLQFQDRKVLLQRMETSQKHSEENENCSEMEHNLLQVARWAIASIKLIGHFPYSVKRQRPSGDQHLLKYLALSRLSLPILHSLFLLAIFLCWLSNYYFRLWPKLRFKKVFGPTENLAYTFMILSTSAARIHTLLRSLYYARRNLRFWRLNCQLLQIFRDAGYNFRLSWFSRLRWETGVLFFASTGFVIVQTIYVHLYTAIKGSKSYNIAIGKTGFWPMLPDSEERFGSGLFWTCINYLRLANCWLIFFIRLYTQLFRQISQDCCKKDELQPIFLCELANNIYWKPQKIGTGESDENKLIFSKIYYEKQVKHGNRLFNVVAATRPFVPNRAKVNLQLYTAVRKMIREFNRVYAMEFLWDVSGFSPKNFTLHHCPIEHLIYYKCGNFI